MRDGSAHLDILVNNAARQQTRASILDVSSDDFDATMKTLAKQLAEKGIRVNGVAPGPI